MNDLQLARATTHRVARTFGLATRLLPRDVRDDVYRLYLVFRTLDDLVDDGHPDAEARVAAVEAWARGGPSVGPEATTLDALDAPRGALLSFCAGMRADLEPRGHDTEGDLDRYCHQVAGTVGLTMAELLGARGDAAMRAADALGKAMQRTNVLRDIDEDRRNGRVYLARETIERYGGSLEPGARAVLMRDQIARADALYDEGIAGIPLLPRGRRAIAAAAGMYREILRQIEREGYGARPGRAVVATPRKLAVAATWVCRPAWTGSTSAAG
jgi:phytoene synthase